MEDIVTAASALDRALDRLETGVEELCRRGAGSENAVTRILQADRARLAAELDATRGREKALESLAGEASQALGAAISEVKAALAVQKQP